MGEDIYRIDWTDGENEVPSILAAVFIESNRGWVTYQKGGDRLKEQGTTRWFTRPCFAWWSEVAKLVVTHGKRSRLVKSSSPQRFIEDQEAMGVLAQLIELRDRELSQQVNQDDDA